MSSFHRSNRTRGVRNSQEVSSLRLSLQRPLKFEPLEQRNLLTAFDLSAYELNIDEDEGLADPEPTLSATDFSGVAYSGLTDSLFIVDDDAGDVKGLYEYELDGTFVRGITLQGFDSPEAIYWLGGENFAIVEEPDIGFPAEKHISLVEITAASSINKNSFEQIVLTGPIELFAGGNNDGPEGIAFDPNGGDHGILYVAKEKDDPRLFEVILDENMEADQVNEISVSGITGSAADDDLSDIFFADGGLFAVSDQGERAFRIDLATESVVGVDIDLPLG